MTGYITPTVGAIVRTPEGLGSFAGVTGHLYVVDTFDGRRLGFAPEDVERTGTIQPESLATIDHGRVATIERRQAFSQVHVEILDQHRIRRFVIPTDAMLSPRRIARIGRFHGGAVPSEIADAVYGLLKTYRDNGYDLGIVYIAPVWGWRVALRAGRL